MAKGWFLFEEQIKNEWSFLPLVTLYKKHRYNGRDSINVVLVIYPWSVFCYCFEQNVRSQHHITVAGITLLEFGNAIIKAVSFDAQWYYEAKLFLDLHDNWVTDCLWGRSTEFTSVTVRL